MRQEQKKGEKHPNLKNLIKLGVLTLAVTSAYRLLFGAIKHGGQTYGDGKESGPIVLLTTGLLANAMAYKFS